MVRARSSNLWGGISILLIICCLVTVGLCVNTAAALPGSGSQQDPWRIRSLTDFDEFAADANYWDDYTLLETDVNLAGRTYSTAVIAPDTNNANYSFDGTAFTRVFDGNDHKIINLTIDGGWAGNYYLGLFGYIGDGEVRNLGIEGGSIIGSDYLGCLVGYNHLYGSVSNCYSTGSVSGVMTVGCLVGYNSGSISNCHSTGDVSGVWTVGGLVGQNRYQGSVSKCYSTGSVSGSAGVGGLVGYNEDGRVSSCYSTGDVSGGKDVGGLVGANVNGGTIANCYSAGRVSGGSSVGGLVGSEGTNARTTHSFWDIESSGQSSSAGGTGKTTADMQMASTFTGWGCGAIWTIDEGNDYPRLLWENMPGDLLPQLTDLLAGAGTQSDPYLVYTAEQLNMIGLIMCDWDKNFKLMADIDLAAFTGTSFNIIGERYSDSGWVENPFTGVFDGSGHTISNFTYSSTGISDIGLFRLVDGEDAEIKDLGLINPNVDVGTRNYRLGSLVGRLQDGTITNCYVEGGSVSGVDYVGGLVGLNWGTIANCYAEADASGNGSVGELIGLNYGRITNCYSTGSVRGDWHVGGLVGTNIGIGTISNCYATGNVVGDRYVGGLVGVNGGTINNCYSEGDISGTVSVGGLVGYNWEYMSSAHGKITNSYAIGSVEGQERVGGLVGWNDFATISNCYSSGSVTGMTNVGGLVGERVSGTVSDSFWDMETSGLPKMCGIGDCNDSYGKTTGEMQMAGTFTDAGWDFVDVWEVCEGTNYPILVWQIPVGDFICPDGVNMSDFSFFARYWLRQNCNSRNAFCMGIDLNRSGTVDVVDLGIFLENWLASVE